MPNPSRDPKPLSTEGEKINQCGQELGVLRAQAAATAQRIERFNGLLNVLGEVQPSRLHQSHQTQLAQDLCTRLVEQKYYTHARIVLLNADGYPASGAQAGFSEDLEKIIHPREDGGWACCLQSARERSTVLAIMDPAFSCGPCPLAVACQRQGVLVTNISCGQRVFGILAVAVPRTSLAHVEEKSALRLLSNALGDEFFNLEVGSDLEKCRRWIRESERMQTALNALPTPLVIYDGNGQPFWSNQAQGTRQPSSHQQATGTEDRCWLIEKQSYLEPDGSQGGTIEIAWNATETARSETALRACLETAQHMLAAGHDFLWTADIYGRFTSVSPQVETLLGFAPAELQGRPLAEFMEPEKDAPYENSFEMALTSATPLSRVMRTLHHRDGREITIEISAQPLYGLEGTCRGFQGCCRDVTEQTRAEKALLESESRFRNIFSSSPSALVLADPQGRVVEINRSMCELFGIMDKTMITQMNLTDYLPLSAEDHAALRAHRIVRREGTFNPDTFQGNRAFKPAQAGPLHLEVLISFFPWQRDSAAEGFLVQMQDITDRKNAEDALCQSEEKYRMIVENSGSALLIINEDLTLSLINREMENLCGFTLMELQAMDHWYKNIFPEDLEKIKYNHYQRRVDPNSVPSSYEVRFHHKNGGVRTVLFRVTLIPSTRQSMAAILDITERKRTEEALRLSEEKYRATFENSGTAMALLEDNLTLSLVNQKMVDLLGWDRNDLERKASWPEFLADQADHDNFIHNRQLLLQDPAAILKSGECGIKHQDGGTRDVMAAMTYLPASRQFLISLVDITESKAAERKLKESEQRYRLLADNIHDVIWMTDAEGKLTFITPSITRLRGFSVEEVLAQTLEQIFTPESVERVRAYNAAEMADTTKTAWNQPLELEQLCKDGSTVWTEVHISPVPDADGRMQGFVGMARDISSRRQAETEQRRLEEQLRQSQKMEIIGHLAGGIAHDFNNLLTPILGYADMAASQVPAGLPLANDIRAIQETAERAARLTRQLLAFSLKQVLHMNTVQLNREVTDFIKMLHSFIGEHIVVHTDLAPDLGCIKADLSQIQQVLMNLAVNARDAMPRGGSLTFSTANVQVNDVMIKKHPSLKPGLQVRLTVTDTGTGIAPEILRHIFEPFFTTKERGKGTGLGLSMVYGIITQHQGAIAVESEPDKGAAFHIYFPLVEALPSVVEPTLIPETKNNGHETILVVEDESMVRKLTVEFLSGQGYTVLEAADPLQALEIVRTYTGSFDLLLTDIIMPGMNGKELYQQLVKERPELKVLYMSGYSEDVIAHQGVLEPGTELLAKPFALKALLAKVRSVLDRFVAGAVKA